MTIWLDGRVHENPDDAVVSVLDHGLTVGDGVFETLNSIHGVPFALTRHLRRLSRSAAGMGLPEPDHDVLREAVAAVLHGTDWARGRVRITLTGGPGPAGSDRGSDGPTLLVTSGPQRPADAAAQVTVVPWTRNERAATAGLKTTSYADNVVALAHARGKGCSEALFANTQGQLCEGTGSNVFLVRDGRVLTPTLASGCLAGISRELVLEWFGEAVEEDVPVEALTDADEVFLVSTVRDVQPVRTCDDRDYPAPGPVTRRVQQAWSDGVAETLDP
jgi:branched-chain amino acid aminotransferase